MHSVASNALNASSWRLCRQNMLEQEMDIFDPHLTRASIMPLCICLVAVFSGFSNWKDVLASLET